MADEKPFAEKLAILVHHWHHHNEDHCAEFSKWRQEADRQGMTAILPAMDACIAAMEQVNCRLAEIERLAGGGRAG
ncbi:MAG: hypothetical protein AB1568_05360 [Thermodesulfobacteriota bacterium]